MWTSNSGKTPDNVRAGYSGSAVNIMCLKNISHILIAKRLYRYSKPFTENIFHTFLI